MVLGSDGGAEILAETQETELSTDPGNYGRPPVYIIFGNGAGVPPPPDPPLPVPPPPVPNRNVTPVQVGVEWLTGNGPRVRHFTDGDFFTELLRSHENIQSLVLGVKDGTLPLEGLWDYGLAGLQGVPKYIRDYSTILTFGQTGNLAVTYLGSYKVIYEASNGMLHITAWNFSRISSGTHPPVVGYWPIWSDNIGQPLDNWFSTGRASPTGQVFHFHEDLR